MDRPRRNDRLKLDVYRCALDLYRRIARIVDAFPRGEADLRSQMRRASKACRSISARASASAAEHERQRTRSRSGRPRSLSSRWIFVEIDGVAPLADVMAAPDLTDRIAAMLTKLMRSARAGTEDRDP